MTETLELEAPFSGELYHEYTFRVRARDLVGHTSDWITTTVAIVNQTKYYFLDGRRVAMRKGDKVFYLYGDHLGSTSLTTDENGVKLSEDRYLPYGGGRLSDGISPTDFGFTDQRNEVGLGLIDYNARYYDPFLGRFISADSIVPELGNPQALNRYSYVYNNPLKYVDPSGHCAEFGDDACWSEYEKIKHDCPECETIVTGDGVVSLHEANYDRLKAYYKNRIANPVDHSEAMAQLAAVELVGETIGGIACEPCDWVLIGKNWTQDDFHPTDLAGFLPGLSGGMVKGTRQTLYRAVSAAELADIYRTGIFRPLSDQMGGKWFAETYEHAAEWGRRFTDWSGEPALIIKTDVPVDIADQMHYDSKLDFIGPARYADGPVLDAVNQTMSQPVPVGIIE